MSGWTPSPEDSGSPGAPETGDKAGQGGGFGTQAGDSTQAGGAPGQGFGTQAGYGAGYGSQPSYGTPGYAQPGPDGSYPAPPPRGRGRMWLGVIIGIVVLAVVIAGVSAYIVNRSKKWVLSAPTTISGLGRDTNPLDQQEFSDGVSSFKSTVTKLPNYGKLTSTVSAIYTLGSSQTVGFAGLNGTFNSQIVLKPPAGGPKVSNVDAGPHGGAAECVKTSTATICQWSTSTTIGRLDIIPSQGGGSVASISAADSLLLKIRAATEHPQHKS